MRTRVTVAIVMGMLVAMVPQTIFAAVPGQEQPPGEQHLIFLVIGVFAVWAAFFAYAFYMARKNIALRRELEDLERELGRRQS